MLVAAGTNIDRVKFNLQVRYVEKMCNLPWTIFPNIIVRDVKLVTNSMSAVK